LRTGSLRTENGGTKGERMTRLIEHVARAYYRHPKLGVALFWTMVFLAYVSYLINLFERAR
jgi:hypothetical protein